MSRKHSRFAPSSLHRILACPQSVGLAEAAVQADPLRAKSSSYAAEGTVAHDIAAAILGDQHDRGAFIGDVVEIDGHAITVDAAMHEHGQAYADYVRRQMHKDSKLMVEEIVDLNEVVGRAAEMYGHLDAATWSLSAGHLDITDYKYGAGIAVSPVENPQLMAYALGALFMLRKSERRRIRTVGVHVFQPRMADGIADWKIDAVDLQMWAAEILSPTINAIVRGLELPPLSTGAHCRFCPALSVCPAWAEKVDREMREAFSTPIGDLPGSDLAQALSRVRELAPWIDGVEEEAKRRLLEGGTGADDVPGWKPVVAQWRRFWANGADPKAIAKALGLKPAAVLTEPALRTPADLEKKLKKSDRGKLDDLVERKPYGVSIVPEGDPRPDSRGGEIIV
jgi:Protein of unknown function (DUF2800)